MLTTFVRIQAEWHNKTSKNKLDRKNILFPVQASKDHKPSVCDPSLLRYQLRSEHKSIESTTI